MTTSIAPALAASAVSKHYGTTRALAGLDLSIAPGQVCAILGQNGAGKTTLIECALGLAQPTTGKLSVFGHSAGDLAARRLTGVMLQDADLPDLLSAREHLALYQHYYPEADDRERVIAMTGIGAFAGRRYKKLSGGQKRRVQFALALIGRPRLLFLDEPTTGLDQDARTHVWNNVRELARGGTTIVLTTHYLEEADALADRIVVLHDGRIIADDDAARIRERVGGAVIQCQTRVAAERAATLPAVKSALPRGRQLQLLSENPAATLSALLQLDPELADLSVQKPSLAEAFAALTNQHREPVHGD